MISIINVFYIFPSGCNPQCSSIPLCRPTFPMITFFFCLEGIFLQLWLREHLYWWKFSVCQKYLYFTNIFMTYLTLYRILSWQLCFFFFFPLIWKCFFTLSFLEVFLMGNVSFPLLFAPTPFNFLTALKFSLYHWFEQFNFLITWYSFLHVSGEQWPSFLLGLYFKLTWKNIIFRFFFPS